MQLKMAKKNLLKVLDAMQAISTRSIKSEYDMADRVTINAENKSVTFFASNGYLDGKWTWGKDQDDNLTDLKEGKATVCASKFRDLIAKLPTADASSILNLEVNNDMLVVQDVAAKRKKVRAQLDSRHHQTSLIKPKGMKFTIEQEFFSQGIEKVSPFVSDLGYKIKYLMVCFHFLPEETRFICGNGACFAVYRCDVKNPDAGEKGVKYLIPCSQALIIKSVLNGQSLDITWENEQKCLISVGNGFDLLLKGIPSTEYIEYDKHAFRMDEAKAIADVPIKDFVQAIAVVGACRDKDKEKEAEFLSCKYEATNDSLDLTVEEGKYQCEVSLPCDYHNLDNKSRFAATYAHEYLSQIANASSFEYLRFYCIDEEGIVVCQTAGLTDNVDSRGVRFVKEEHSKLSFFFCAVPGGNNS